MRLAVVFLLVFTSLFSYAQTGREYPVDSATFYQRKIAQLQRKTFDSLRNTEEYKATRERVEYYQRKSDGYGSFVLFTDVAQADFSKFNTSITASGFSPLSGSVYRLGFGFSTKTRRTVVDFFMLASGLSKKSKKGQETITTLFSSGVILDIGYDFIKKQAINIYPYAGLSMRTSDLTYSAPVQTNPTFTNISNLVVNKRSVEAYSSKLGFQAGVGFDFVIAKGKRDLGGTMFFLKAGVNRPVGKEKYKIEGIKYDPGIEYGKWIITAGFKFFGRN